MSLPQQDPTWVLQDALGKFEAALSPEDVSRLHEIEGTPSADSVVHFTALLDQKNAQRRGPSIASRIYTFLSSVQQFSSIVDVFVSSNPTVAALVWGAVRLTMLITVNSCSYFDEISKLFLKFGHWSPALKEYESLFPSSLRLQQAICNFHAATILCCTQVVIMSKRSWTAHFAKAFRSPAQTELKEFVDAIQNRAREFKLEVGLAKAQSDQEEAKLQTQERQSANKHRTMLSRFVVNAASAFQNTTDSQSTLVTEQKKRINKGRLDSISTFDYLAPFKRARARRYPGTGSWITEMSIFQEWKDSNSSEVLLLLGKIGSGKTILAANIIDYLSLNREPQNAVCFFFPMFDFPKSLEAETIIRSLIRQNLELAHVPYVEDYIKAAESSYYDFTSLRGLLRCKLNLFEKNFIVIDALDECMPSERQLIYETLKSAFGSGSAIKLLIISRGSLKEEVKSMIGIDFQIPMDSPEASMDLPIYIRQCLEDRRDTGDLAINHPGTLEKIIQSLIAESQGMYEIPRPLAVTSVHRVQIANKVRFLWAALEIEDICAQVCEEDVIRTLDNLPKTLGETFSRAVHRIISQGTAAIAKDIFRWVSAAQRPLLVDELKEALSIKLDETHSRPETRIQCVEKLPHWCGNLVDIDELSGAVQFVHHSVQLYVYDTKIARLETREAQDFHGSQPAIDDSVGRLCITYLDWNDFKTAMIQSEKTITQQKLPDPMDIAIQSFRNETRSKRLARLSRFMQAGSEAIQKPATTYNIPKRLQPGDEGTDTIGGMYPFLGYAKEFWFSHVADLKAGSRLHAIWTNMISGNHHMVKPPWGAKELNEPATHVIAWALARNHHTFILYLIDKVFEYPQHHRQVITIILPYVKELDVLEQYLSKLLLHESQITVQGVEAVTAFFSKGQPLGLPMMWESEFKRDIWYDNDASDNTPNKVLDPKLWREALKEFKTLPFSRLAVYCTLVYHGLAEEMCDMMAMDESLGGLPSTLGVSPLLVAIVSKHIRARDLLMRRNVDPNMLHHGWSLLYVAVKMGCSGAFAKTLIDYGARVNDPSENGEVALHAAVDWASFDLTDLLVTNKADVNAKRRDGTTSLNTATQLGQVAIVRLLLSNGADPDAQGKDNETSLSWATRFGMVKIVELLLDHKADANVSVEEDMTALHIAVSNGSADIVQLLVASGSEINAQGGAERTTPLEMAVLLDDSSMVELLLVLGADATLRNQQNLTVLHLAVMNSKIGAAKLLIARGADVNAHGGALNATPLHCAVCNENLPMVNLLLSNGATVELSDEEGRCPLHEAIERMETLTEIYLALMNRVDDVNAKMHSGVYLLQMAIDRGPKDIILDLLCRGANAQTRWANGRTALHHAMVRRGSDILLELVARGGDVNAATTAGDRPLHGAAQIGNIHALIFLLGQPGIDINAQNNRGETPLHKALTGKRSNETVRMLLNAGALQDIVDKSGRKAIG